MSRLVILIKNIYVYFTRSEALLLLLLLLLFNESSIPFYFAINGYKLAVNMIFH